MLNRWTGIGHLGEDPEEVEEKGKPAALLRLATNHRGGPAVWHDVIVPGKRGQACLHRLRTGSRVYVQGRIRHRRVWDEDEERFERRTEIVTVGDVLFLDRPTDPSHAEHEPDPPPKVSDADIGIPPNEPDFNEDRGVGSAF
jgi:single-strand DNA-binding protein